MTSKKSTSFIQYSECKICKIHHNAGNKHLYSSHHQKNLKMVLKKCLFKVSESKKTMKTIEVHNADWEKDRNFWCYFCIKELPKHLSSNNLMIENLGLIHHLADHEHYDNVKKFLKKNRMHTQKPEKYIIRKSDHISFLDTLPAAEARYLQKVKDIYNEQVSEIRAIEKQRVDFLSQVASEVCSLSVTLYELMDYYYVIKCKFMLLTNSRVQCAVYIKIKVTNTVPEAYNRNSNGTLEINDKSCLKKDKATPATKARIPPWLLPAHITSYSMLPPSSRAQEMPVADKKPVIGPSMDDFLKHVKQQETKKLNPNRVGATFDHNMATSASWLPSFSKISNTSSRKHAASRFRAQKRKR